MYVQYSNKTRFLLVTPLFLETFTHRINESLVTVNLCIYTVASVTIFAFV